MIEAVVANSILILGVHSLFLPSMILFKLVKPLSKLPTFLRKPLYECLICMSSIWGILFFVAINNISLTSNWSAISKPLILHVLEVCGFNVILDSCVYYWRRGGNRFIQTKTELK